MRIWIPTNPFWYLAVAILFGPYVALALLKADWIVRFLGSATLMLTAGLAPLVMALRKRALLSMMRAANARNEAPLLRKFGEARILFAVRSLFAAFGITVLWYFLPPFANDVIAMARGEAPLTMTAKVLDARTGNGLIDEYLQIAGSDESFTAPYFAPRHIMVGNRYEFLYLPHSNLILEARPIEDGG